MGITVRGLSEIEKSYRAAAKLVARTQARAVARVGVTIVAEQARAITARVNLKVSTVKATIVTRKKPSISDVRLILEVKEKGIPLKDYGARQTRKGVSVKVLKGGGAKTLRAAFGAGKFGGNFFGRVGKGSKKYASPHVGRLPIAKLYGPSILSQFIRDDISKKGVEAWDRRLPIELDRETSFALSQAGLI